MRINTIISLFVASASAHEHVPDGSKEVRLRTDVVIENRVIGVLDVIGEPADDIYRFGKAHGLDDGQRQNLLSSICEKLACTRQHAITWSAAVDIGGRKETIQIVEGTEAADGVYAFVHHHNLTESHRQSITSQACASIECTRTEPVIWKKSIDIGDKWNAKIEILLHQEPADVIFSTLRPYGVNYADRRKIFEEVKRDAIPYTRENAKVFSKNIDLAEKSISVPFALYDDGSEPVDVLYTFSKEHSIESYFKALSNTLLPDLCGIIACKRRIPRVWYNPINTEDGQQLGTLEILMGEEPVDTIANFFRGLSMTFEEKLGYRRNLLGVVCKTLECSRTTPVVYRKTINDENGRNLGQVEIEEGEEAVDAVVRFIRKKNVAVDDIALKNYIFGDACRIDQVQCTRNVGLVYSRDININDVVKTLMIYENQEPADRVHEWSQENSIGYEYFDNIMNEVCGAELVECSRRKPVIFSIPITGPDGEFINTFLLEMGDEPVDTLYKFFAANGLFKKKWDFRSVFAQICAMNNVQCRRQQAIKYFDSNFTMAGEDFGPLAIWEDQEVIDVLYAIRNQHNLTVEDQMKKFIDICKEPEVFCERSKAIIYKKAEITKLDYEKFGNETCKRQFVGVKYRTSLHQIPFGAEFSDYLKKEHVSDVVEHPLFCVFVLFFFQILFLSLTMIRPFRKKVHPFQKAVISFWLFVFVSIIQTLLVEPDVQVDQAMHVHEGKLPDLIVFENEEPVDALIKWGKEAAKDHHPVVREPFYYEIFDEMCSQVECSRTRSFEYHAMGAMTYLGQEFAIDFYNPAVDPFYSKKCLPIMNGKANTCIEDAAKEFCERLFPQPNNCIPDITTHIASQLEIVDSKRLDAKCSYKRFGLEMDAPGHELYRKAASVVRQRGMNMSPFRSVTNGTVAFDSWSLETREAHAGVDTFAKISTPEAREWNDKPCTPYFGGALCAKLDKDGNMLIETG